MLDIRHGLEIEIARENLKLNLGLAALHHNDLSTATMLRTKQSGGMFDLKGNKV